MTGRPRFLQLAMGAAVILVQGLAAADTPPTYRVDPLTFDAHVADTVGPKRAGSVCLPAGSIAWRDARPEVGDARDAFAAGLAAGGLAVADPDNPFHDNAAAGAERVLRAKLRGVRLSACVPPGGWGRVLNHGHGVKGDGIVAVSWRVYARGHDAPVASGVSCAAYPYHENQATLPLMTLAGIKAVGRQVAAAVDDAAARTAALEECRRLSHAPGATFMVTDAD